jgi:hypothetical protein
MTNKLQQEFTETENFVRKVALTIASLKESPYKVAETKAQAAFNKTLKQADKVLVKLDSMEQDLIDIKNQLASLQRYNNVK